eukprot:m.200244 g.200244  ORF g.200244 m.200244 type:complete len:61 (-) comp13708_c0_seq1:296-478(-)
MPKKNKLSNINNSINHKNYGYIRSITHSHTQTFISSHIHTYTHSNNHIFTYSHISTFTCS